MALSFSDEYLSLRKKRLQNQAEENTYKPSSSKNQKTVTGSSTVSSGDSFEDEYMELRKNRLENKDIAPVKTVGTLSKKEDVAPVKNNQQKRTWFSKGALKDGVSIGNIAKTLLGTDADILENIGTGSRKMLENVTDAGLSVASMVGKAVGADIFSKNVEEIIKQDLSSKDTMPKEAKLAANAMTNMLPGPLQPMVTAAKGINALNGYINKGKSVDDVSVLGERSDSLVQTGTQVLLTQGLASYGVPWQVTAGLTSYGGEYESALNEGATTGEAAVSSLISAGGEVLSEYMTGGMFGETGLDDVLIKDFSRAVSNKVYRNLLKFGVKSAGEGLEEAFSWAIGNVGKKLTYENEKSWKELFTSEEAVDELIESVVGGALMGGVFQGADVLQSKQTGRDYVTELTANEQKVVDQEYKNRIAEQEKNGDKLTNKEKSKIYDSVVSDMEKGYISTDAIEEALGGDTYKKYQSAVKEEADIRKVFDSLNQMKQSDMTGEQIDMRNELKQQLEDIKSKDTSNQLRAQLGNEVMSLVRGDRLSESYNEKFRRGQSFEADLTKYNDKQKAVVQKAIDSGILNNTNRTHEFVDMVAKISADKGVLFDFANNAKLKDSGFAVDGKTVNGFVTKDGITLNIDSAKALNSVVGHEVTHVLEGTELYTALQSAVMDYAKTKGEYDRRRTSLTELYKDIEGADIDAELTADLIGDYLFTDSDFIKNLSATNRNVFQKIYDEIKYLCKVATAGSKEARELEKVKRAFENAYKEGSNKTSSEANGDAETKYSLVTDQDTIDFLENQDYIVTYKAMQVVDGKLYPPMSAQTKETVEYTDKNGNKKTKTVSKWKQPSELGKWQQSDENPGAIKKFNSKGVGVFDLIKGNGKTIQAAYNPYEHTSNIVLNDQFEEAYNRDNLVTVEYHIPKSELTSGYKAQYAKDAVGLHEWKSGPVAKDLKNPRQVYLTRWSKPVRILPDSEVAAKYKEILDGTGLSVPFNVVTPSLLAELEKAGVPIDYEGSPMYKSIQRRAAEKKAAKTDAKYSVSDSEGNQLTNEQQEYFKDSKVRDENGNLKVMYHGSQDVGFHVFNSRFSDDGTSLFFVDSNTGAKGYSGTNETYTAKSFRTADDFRKFFDEIGASEYEVVEEGGKFKLLEDGDEVAASDTASGIYDEFRDWSGLGQGSANYKVYLNLKNPLEVDAKNNNWDELPSIDGNDTRYEYIKLVGFNRFEGELQIEYHINGEPAPVTEYVDPYEKFDAGIADRLSDLSIGESIKNIPVKPMTTREYSKYAKENGYDGVIFKNIIDTGLYASGRERFNPSTVAIAFDSNQIKSVANENPTSDPDIRYSLNELNDDGLTMTYVKVPNQNTQYYGSTYGQNIEPSGEYMSMDTMKGKNKIDGYEYGTIQFKKPLVLEHINTSDTGWKKTVSDMYNGLTGKKLSNALMKDGYDAIVTYDEYGYNEIVNLNGKKLKDNNSDTKYSLTEYTDAEKKEHNKAVVDHFGKTYNWAETGYVLLDGTKLDLSGKHEGAPGGYRTVDHRDIVAALGDDYGDGSYSGSLIQFMSEGNIRISPESDGINLSVKPTKAQEQALSSFISRARGEVLLDIDDLDGYTVVSVEYPRGTHANKVLNDIREWFDNGKKPEVPNTSMFRSISANGEQQKQNGNYNVYGKDIALEAPVQETAPIQENVVAENETTMFPDDLAPMPESEAETRDRLASIEDSDAPPETEAPYVESEDVTVDDPFEGRDWYEVSNRKVKAYMYENPEVKPYFQAEARALKGELLDTVKGERLFDDRVYYETNGEAGFGGTKRFTSDSIATLLDEWGMSYADIEKGLDAIIEDNGAENIASAKKIEFMLNDRLMNGFTDFYSGDTIPPDQGYLNLLNEKQITEYSKESFYKLMENADSYAPPADDIAPVATTEESSDVQDAPVKNIAFKKPEPKTDKNPKIVSKAEADRIAQVLSEEPTPANRKSRAWAKFRANVLDKGSVFEDLSLKNKNRELMGKWNFILSSESRAQRMMGNGAIGVKSLNAIRDEVGNTGKTKEFYEYLYHKHNADRMTLEQRYEDTPNKPVFGDSVTAEVSQRVVDQYESAYPEFKSYADDVYAYMNHLRKLMVDNGVISQETSDLWAEMYPHYVPIRRAGDTGIDINVPLDTRRTGVNAPVKAATGGSSDILPLFDTMALRTQQTYKAIAKNSFGVELKNTLGSTISNDSFSVDDIIDSIDAQDGLLQEGKNGSNPTFTVFENGEKVTFEITEDMYDALKPVSEGLAYTNPIASTISSMHRGLLTEYNPVFMLTNAIKDAQDVLINSQHAAKTYAKVPEAFAQLVSKGYWYNEYMDNGGEQNTYFDSKTNTFKTENKGLDKILDLPPFSTVSALNNFIEMTPRLAEYIASREAGRSIEVSMLDAARVTTNFQAGGDITKFLNRNGATFLNASVQGAMQQVRNVREAKANGIKGVVNLATKFAIAGLPAVLLNNLVWDDDKDYEELSDYVKQNYYVIGKYDDGKFIRIPKGRALAVIQNAVEQVSNALTGDDELDLATFLELAVSNLAPNNPIDNNILAPVLQVANNKTWYGEDLVPSRLQKLPNAEQFDETTDSISKWIGEKTDISPYKINYLMNQYSGGVGDVVLPMLTPKAENGDNSFTGNMIAPLKDKFTTDSVLKNQNVSDFYDKIDELAVNANSSKATDDDTLKYKYMNSMNAELSDLYKKKRELQNSNMDDAAKYEAVRNIQKQIVDITRESLNSYEDVSYNTARDGEYASIGGKYFKRGDDGQWQTLSGDSARKYEITSAAGDAMYATDGTEHYRWYEPGEDSTAEPGWRKLTDEQVEKQNEVTNGLGITPEKYWSNKEEYDFSYEKPEKYAVAKSVGGYEAYKGYSKELNDIKADKDENGKSISGSRKEKVYDYINSLDADYGEKIILFKSEYNADDTYNYEIIDYLNSRSDISWDEMAAILKELGFTVRSDGTITW